MGRPVRGRNVRKFLATAAWTSLCRSCSPGVAEAHGYTQNPRSRSANCARGVVRDCGPIQYEPQSVEGPKGFPSGGPADGKLCAAGFSQFALLDDPRGGTWPAKGPDERRELHLHVDADRRPRHDGRFATSSPRTDDGIPARHSPGHNSKRHPSSRALQRRAAAHGDFAFGQLPSGKSGRHLIYAVWDIADTSNAFYSCADVTFS